jgi:hypothetical protein
MSSETFPHSPQMISLQNKIGWICQSLRWLIFVWLGWILIMISLPLFDLAGTIERTNAALHLSVDPVTTQSFIASRCIIYMEWTVATLIGIAGWKLMTGYLNGDIFSEAAADNLKRVGQAALLATLVGVITRPISTWMLSHTYFHTIPKWQFLTPQDLLYVLIGLLIIGLARIYHAAAEINAENKSFI